MSDGVIQTYLDGPTMARACDFLYMKCYAVCMDNLVLFPHQQALEFKICRFTFESMLIKYLICDRVIPTCLDCPTMVKACDFIYMKCYAVFMDNLVSFPHQLALIV